MELRRAAKLASYPKLALDTNIFIYAIEGNENFPLASEIFREIKKKNTNVVTSILSIHEAVILLYQMNLVHRIPKYVEFIRGGGAITVFDINQTIALKAAELRAKYRPKLKAPDAIQLATAILNGASVFITANRKDFKPGYFENVRIEII